MNQSSQNDCVSTKPGAVHTFGAHCEVPVYPLSRKNLEHRHVVKHLMNDLAQLLCARILVLMMLEV